MNLEVSLPTAKPKRLFLKAIISVIFIFFLTWIFISTIPFNGRYKSIPHTTLILDTQTGQICDTVSHNPLVTMDDLKAKQDPCKE
jgi:hypothetical protein